jgi:uncharacterized membrane protein affecting hemolysin expression
MTFNKNQFKKDVQVLGIILGFGLVIFVIVMIGLYYDWFLPILSFIVLLAMIIQEIYRRYWITADNSCLSSIPMELSGEANASNPNPSGK